MAAHRDVMLTGSFAAPDAETVFRRVSGALGNRIRRIPDGETGERSQWIRWQVFAFRDNPSFALDPHLKGTDYATDFYVLKPGVSAKDLTFKPLGYAENAIASYAVLSRLKREGAVAPGTRLQISIPPPYNVLDRHVAPKDRLAVEPAYERQMLAEVDEMAAAIPHGELAIQWDAAHEVQNLAGAREGWFDTLAREEEEIVDRLVRLGNRVPKDVELGYHLCYGDFGHKHVVEPTDTGLMVGLTDKLSQRIGRSIEWVHMPVPIGRNDDAYFAPLKDLRLRPETELYLGLVHHSDGAAGTRARIAAAEKVVKDFGIATECGLGRRDPATLPELLRIHAEVADSLNT
jgi:methionine synthase II (cobalamin-independent)